MDPIEQLITHISEASKILHMDASHSALQSNLQRHLAAQHRTSNPDSGYYDYPTVHDVFGDADSGQVVYSKNGVHSMANYKKGEGDSFTLSGHKAVKKSYVAESLVTQESEVQESIDVQEAALDANGRGEICIIKPCTGSMAHYTAESLQRTAKNKAFPKGTKMFIDHQTAEERLARPEGSVFKQAAVTEADAEWKNGKEGLALYAPIKAYTDYVPFINERAKDIGLSVRGTIKPTGKIVNGVPEVQEFAKGISIDFVTKAGAGGKLLTVYESFREQRGERQLPNSQKEGVLDMEVKESDFKVLQDQAALVPKLATRLDRVEEANRRYQVRDIVSRLVQESGLSERGQTRVAKPYLAVTFTPTLKDDVLDETVLEAAVKAAIAEEVAYLQESGVMPTSPVRNMGSDGKPAADKTEDQLAQEAEISLSAISKGMLGIQEQKAS